MRRSWPSRRRRESVGQSQYDEVPFLAAGDGIIDPLPGLTLVVGSTGSGKTVLLDFLKTVYPDAEMWKPDWTLRPEPGLIDTGRPLGDRHPLSDNLLRLALLCDRTPRTLLIDEGLGDAPATVNVLAGWRTLLKDTEHRMVLVQHLRGELHETLTRPRMMGVADQVIMFGSRHRFAKFMPLTLLSPDGEPVGNPGARGHATIWQPIMPDAFVTRRVPYGVSMPDAA